MRPVLKPALRQRWRDGETLQLGTDPAVAVLITGLRAADRLVLGLLDGTRTEAAIVATAREAGVTAASATHLLATLRRAGALEDASARDPLADLPLGHLERFGCELAELSLRSGVPGSAAEAFGSRRQAEVLVLGAGRVGAPVAALLAAAGVGNVETCDPVPTLTEDAVPAGLGRADVGRPRQDALAAAVPGIRIRRRSSVGSDTALVVLAPQPGPDVTTAERLRRDGVPHLAVDAVDGAGIVGPLVLPGRSACLRCLDLHRRDRDPGWRPAGEPDGPVAAGAALAVATASLAAIQVLAFLDQRTAGIPPATVDGTLELRPPDWRLRRRTWPPHPECGCAT